MATHSSRNRKYVPQNRNATIRSREDRRGNLRTETIRRDDDSFTAAVSTNPKNDSTSLFVDFPDQSYVKFDGRQARTLYRLLQKHYRSASKSY
jgi:hypothetical protein